MVIADACAIKVHGKARRSGEVRSAFALLAIDPTRSGRAQHDCEVSPQRRPRVGDASRMPAARCDKRARQTADRKRRPGQFAAPALNTFARASRGRRCRLISCA